MARAIYRVKSGTQAAVYVDELKSMVVLDPALTYSANDPVVKEHPWAFQRDSDVESGVEQATAAPGERRSR